MKRARFGASLLILIALAACGRGGETPGQTADERRQLDNVAERMEREQGTFDTSPDSLVPADEGASGGNAAPPPLANASAPAANNGQPR